MFDVRLLMLEGLRSRERCARRTSSIKHQTSNIPSVLSVKKTAKACFLGSVLTQFIFRKGAETQRRKENQRFFLLPLRLRVFASLRETFVDCDRGRAKSSVASTFFIANCKLQNVNCKFQPNSALRIPHSAFRSGLTLIELLVVVFILTTLVAGVIPILSPNNDVRKIRLASSGLQTFIRLAKAQAAVTGRPHGIAFRESSVGSGVALEVFQISVPPAFAGFSTDSRVRISLPPAPTVYNPGAINTFRFHPRFNGFDFYQLTFELANSTPASLVYDPLPPRMFRVGDEIDVNGNRFIVVDDLRNIEQSFAPSNTKYLDPSQHAAQYIHSLICVWSNYTGQILSPGLKRYQFVRQPTSSSTNNVLPSATAEAPYQFPGGVGIDVQGSIAEGGTFNTPTLFGNSLADQNTFNTDTVAIMFSPAGAVTSILRNSTQVTNVSRLVLLVGRVENAGLQFTTNGSNVVTSGDWVLQNNTKEELEAKQKTINWLNLDTRWLSISARDGRVVVTENAFVDATLSKNIGGNVQQTAVLQIEAAHKFAHEMRAGGAR